MELLYHIETVRLNEDATIDDPLCMHVSLSFCAVRLVNKDEFKFTRLRKQNATNGYIAACLFPKHEF